MDLLATLKETSRSEISAPEALLEETIRQVRDRELEEFLAASFLRMLASGRSEWLHENPWRLLVVNLVQRACAERIQPKGWKELPTHEQVSELAKVSGAAEQQFRNAVAALTSIDRAGQHAQSLFASLNSAHGKAVLVPFLPADVQPRLHDLFNRLEMYRTQRESPSGLAAYEKAVEDARNLMEDLEEWDTKYSQELADGVCSRLLRFLKEDFAANRVAQPTTLAFEQPDKKYPFHQYGQRVTVTVLLRNTGSGFAHQTSVMFSGSTALRTDTEIIDVGRLSPSEIYPINVNSVVTEVTRYAEIDCYAEWKDLDGTPRTHIQKLVISAQRGDIDWRALAQKEPYSLEPVTSESQLVGRKDALDRLFATVNAKNAGSVIIHGQKRVGKTSIAKALESRLRTLSYIVLYLEAGDYVEPDPRQTINRLGAKLCREIKRSDPRLFDLAEPTFTEALSPLADFLDEVALRAPDRRIAIILDEFDQLPLEVYRRGGLGDAFFLTLRSITSRAHVAFVVIGGERMPLVLDAQGQHLNKWKSIPVDYFHQETDWDDYVELIQQPVSHTLEYTPDSFPRLYEVSAGNPYFTNLICQHVFRDAIERRDSSVTAGEVNRAIASSISEADRNTFQHFWEDGILDTGTAAQEKSIRRRRVLISVADTASASDAAPRDRILNHPLLRNVSGAEAELKEFVTRRVLTGDDPYRFKVPLFYRWLRGHGVHDLITTFGDLDVAARERDEQAKLQIRSAEIVGLTGSWPPYRGQVITEDRVRAWLEQFGGQREQRAMFTLLRGLRFYSNGLVRAKARDIEAVLTRNLIRRVETEKRKRDDIIVSYPDTVGKSGATAAALYADETGLYVQNVVERGRVNERLIANAGIQAVLFIDDFVGTGHSAEEQLKQLATDLGKVPNIESRRLVYAAFVAFKDGWQRVQDVAGGLPVQIEVHCSEILDDGDRCFSSSSRILVDAAQRDFVRELALRYGKLLEKRNPLGYGDLSLAVVFERGCPNNSLPILWSESSSPKWTPLFKRL